MFGLDEPFPNLGALNFVFFCPGRYLNNQHIKKQKMSEAELNYGSLSIEHSEQMKEIGELGLDTWKRLVSIFLLEKLFFLSKIKMNVVSLPVTLRNLLSSDFFFSS